MASPDVDRVQAWNDKQYKELGLRAQRSYPNEEFVRFLARHYFPLDPERRSETDILELGSGLCGNLWMVASEGFRAHGVDVSAEALRLGAQVLAQRGVRAELKAGSMTALPYSDGSMDAVFDVLSCSAMTCEDFDVCLGEVHRVLRPGGRFFLFTSGAGSDAFKNFAPAVKLDEWTLNGIYRADSPYYGCFYPQRFDDIHQLPKTMERHGFKGISSERLTRTYHQLEEVFEYISLEAEKA